MLDKLVCDGVAECVTLTVALTLRDGTSTLCVMRADVVELAESDDEFKDNLVELIVRRADTDAVSDAAGDAVAE